MAKRDNRKKMQEKEKRLRDEKLAKKEEQNRIADSNTIKEVRYKFGEPVEVIIHQASRRSLSL